MKFDSSVNLGHILTILALFGGGTVAYTQIQVELTRLSVQVEAFHLDIQRIENRLERLEALQ